MRIVHHRRRPAGSVVVAATVACALGLAAGGCGDGPGATVGNAGIATAAPGAGGEAKAGVWFREEARARGIVFDHHSGAAGEFLMPESFCAGCALFDMDGDGDLDAFLIESDGVRKPRAERRPDRLFRNRGDGTFEDVTQGSGADLRGYGMGVAAGDYDGDGDTDLYVTGIDGNSLLSNDGRGRFTDVADEAGVRSAAWGTSTTFLDYDLDGDLDLWVTNYLRWSADAERRCDGPNGLRDYCSPKAYNAAAPDTLYRNDGNGRFTDVSAAAGLRAAWGNGLGCVAGDFDQDGRPDLFVANDGVENQLWMQKAGGTFRDEALERGCAMDRDGTAKAGMGTVAIDIDDDSDLDLYVVNLVDEGDSIYRNEGRHFVDRTSTLGMAHASRRHTRFGIGIHDFDLDGRLDIYVATGRVSRAAQPDKAADPYAEPDQVVRGLPNGRFDEVHPRGGTDPVLIEAGRGAAFGDVDGDGDVDVLVANRDGPAHLLVNVAPRAGRWAMLRVVNGHGSDAIGATLTAAIGARRVWRDVRAGGSYCSSSDPRIHLGLGDAATIGDVRVRWTDGTVEAFGDLAAEKVHTLRRGAGKPSEWTK